MFVVSLVVVMSERERAGPISRLLDIGYSGLSSFSPYSEPFMVLNSIITYFLATSDEAPIGFLWPSYCRWWYRE